MHAKLSVTNRQRSAGSTRIFPRSIRETRCGICRTSPEGGCADRRFQSGRGEISSAQERSAARLHHHRDSAVGYSNADRWATPVLQADRRVDFAKKHRGASLERSFAALRQRLRGETMKRNLMILPMKTEESNLGFNILLPFFSPLG